MFGFDDTDPRYLIALEEKHEHSVAPYEEMMRRWAARAERGGYFGVILVNTDHTHDDENQHEGRDVALEEAFTQLLNDFRRDHKADVERCTVGYVRIFPPRWMREQLTRNPAYMNELRASHERSSRYMFGVAGNVFETVDEARAWIDTQIAGFVPLLDGAQGEAEATFGQRVGLFYGSTTGVTEAAAFNIAHAWAAHGLEPITPVNIGTIKDLSALIRYDCLILGVPTWNVGQLQDDWEIILPHLDALDFSGKRVALFGVGDQYGYPDNFLDALGLLGFKLIERGGVLVGRWSAEGYEFSESKALVDGKFLGLALDEIHQSALSDSRINHWVKQIAVEFALLPESQGNL